ncbi:MAG: 1,2-phenylacetyl-CoA epoxidase subunit PaaC [Bacteroidota bacterium]
MNNKVTITDTKPINQSTNQLIHYTLHLADNALIMGHRLSEWTGHGPVLEQDIAISNIALDYIGQARNFYQYAALQINQSTDQPIGDSTEDSLAYLRDAIDYKNHLLTELPNGDWAQSILKIFFFSANQFYLYNQLINADDPQISAIAEKSLKEATYHLRWSSEWVVRLGDGTEESHQRMEKAMGEIWPFTGELYQCPSYDLSFIDYVLLKEQWQKKVYEVLTEATLSIPSNAWMQSGGAEGRHTEHLGYILAEMQFLQRAYPNATW